MAKLPADLPENWTQGQIVSPNGTEVGLSEQHGYNYLMKQVNATQTEVNNVGSTIEAALKDVAKEASVQEVNTNIGKTTDVGGSQNSGSVMAKLNKALTELASVTQQTNEVISTLKPLIEEDIRGNTTEIVVSTTFTDGVEIVEPTSTSSITHTIDDVLINQTDKAVYILTVQGTSPYIANKSASIEVMVKATDSLGETDFNQTVCVLNFGNNSELDEMSQQRESVYITAVNIKQIKFKLSTVASRDIWLDWYKIERMR